MSKANRPRRGAGAGCDHDAVDELLDEVQASGLITSCSWPAISDLRCTRDVAVILNYYGDSPDGVAGTVIAPSCQPHVVAVRNWAEEQVFPDMHVHEFAPEDFEEQLRLFHGGPEPMCRIAAMRFVVRP